MACFRAMFLALLIANAGVVASQHQSSIVVWVGKLPALAAFMCMAVGEEASSSETAQLVEATTETEAEEEVADSEENDDAEDESADTSSDEAGEKAEGEEVSEEDEEDEDEHEDEDDEEDGDDEDAEPEDAEKKIEYTAVIDKFDADKDGTLSISELEGKDMTLDKRIVLASIFARADANKDSKLDTDELAVFVQGVSTKDTNFGAAKDKAEEAEEDDEEAEEEDDEEEEEDDREQIDEPMQMMKDLDTDKDGKLTLKELTASKEDVNGNEEDIAVVFATNDNNKDSKLDLQELNVSIQELEKKGI